jgi:hypothetical protein
MFHPNWPSSSVQVFVIKESAALCKAVLFLLCDFLRLLMVVGAVCFNFGVLELNAFPSGFVWFYGCNCLECSYWGGNFLCGGPPLQSFFVGRRHESKTQSQISAVKQDAAI